MSLHTHVFLSWEEHARIRLGTTKYTNHCGISLPHSEWLDPSLLPACYSPCALQWDFYAGKYSKLLDWLAIWGCARKTGTGSLLCQIAPWDCFWDVIISHGFKREILETRLLHSLAVTRLRRKVDRNWSTKTNSPSNSTSLPSTNSKIVV